MQQKYLNAYNDYVSLPFIKISDLEKKYCFSKSSFYRALKKENISLPKKKYYTTCDRSKLIEATKLYSKNYSIKKISIILSMSEKTISKYFKYLDIEIRNKPQQSYNLVCNHTFFNEIDTEEKAYWLGFIFADGNVYKNRLTIELNDSDATHLEKFKKSICANHPLKRYRGRNTISISINSKQLVNNLKKYGCIPNKTNLGYIDNVPICFYKDFLRGYLDGDGYIDKKRYRIIYTIKSKRITNSIKDMFEYVGIVCKIFQEKTYQRLHIENKMLFFKSLKFLYKTSTIYLDRKYEIYKARINKKVPLTR